MKLKYPQLRYGVNTGLQLTEYEAQDIDCTAALSPRKKNRERSDYTRIGVYVVV